MTTVVDLLGTGAHRGLVMLTTSAHGSGDGSGDDAAREITEVAAIDDLADVTGPRAGALLVLLPSALAGREPYELDVAFRRCIEREHAAIVLVGRQQVPITSARLAERGGLALLGVPAKTNVAELILWLNRAVRGGAADTLARAEATLALLARYGQRGDEEWTVEDLLADLGQALGHPLELTAPRADGVEASLAAFGASGQVVAGDRVVGEVSCPTGDHAARLVVPAVAAAVGHRRRRDTERAFAPSQTRAELLTQIVVAEPGHLAGLDAQARRIGFPVDLTHLAALVRLEPREARSVEARVSAQRRLVRQAELTALELLLPRPGWWHVARVADGLLVVASDDAEAGSLAGSARRALTDLLAALHTDEAALYAGLGTDQRGIGGLRQSAVEARAAADLAEQAGRDGVLTTLDSTGVRRVLADLWASPLSRRIILGLLAPLDALGPERAATALETLGAYLDHQCSPKHAGAVLHLHPNAVTYRIRRIEETLDVDLRDPDVRFGLHLACRMRGSEVLTPA
ncbi:hypothetical protein E8D34_02780 [Nocardioides sp. GY 10113]|uniref:PucR family transcriptional regulator n=1 Tax=Nocardioides sp. GY 10113 TaxID=2569761 RepID=UPI0010A8FD49|nr:helix-turn-helix domain-containing protein [Nocardioides sp. GY 10113]TIC88622.1 hypothetical protein E8D34_02780 [Nocardioides sp. GY 10113]